MLNAYSFLFLKKKISKYIIKWSMLTKEKDKKRKMKKQVEGRKEHVDDVRKRNMFTLVSWLLLACLLLGKLFFTVQKCWESPK